MVGRTHRIGIHVSLQGTRPTEPTPCRDIPARRDQRCPNCVSASRNQGALSFLHPLCGHSRSMDQRQNLDTRDLPSGKQAESWLARLRQSPEGNTILTQLCVESSEDFEMLESEAVKQLVDAMNRITAADLGLDILHLPYQIWRDSCTGGAVYLGNMHTAGSREVLCRYGSRTWLTAPDKCQTILRVTGYSTCALMHAVEA